MSMPPPNPTPSAPPPPPSNGTSWLIMSVITAALAGSVFGSLGAALPSLWGWIGLWYLIALALVMLLLLLVAPRPSRVRWMRRVFWLQLAGGVVLMLALATQVIAEALQTLG